MLHRSAFALSLVIATIISPRLASLTTGFVPLSATPPAHERPLRIEAVSRSIESAMVSGPEFHAPEHFTGIEDYYHPRVNRLRDEYQLEKIVAGETSEFRRLLKLRHWVHTRWPIDNDQKFSGDAQ